MAEADASKIAVCVDINENSPNSSIDNSTKQLTEYLPSPRLPENINQQYNNNENESDTLPALPLIRLPRYEFSEIQEQSLPISPFDTQPPKLETYQSEEMLTPAITCDTSHKSLFPDIDVIVEEAVDSVLPIQSTTYATNPEHSQQNLNQNNANGGTNNLNNANNGSNNQNTPNQNNNNNNQHNRRNNDDEKERDVNNNGHHRKQQSKSNINATEYTYFPQQIYKNNGNVKISKKLTTKILPKNIKQKHIKYVYEFLYKFIAINLSDKNVCDCGNFVILNCGFQDLSGQSLYCFADKVKHKNHSYAIRDTLFTKKTISSLLLKFRASGLPSMPSMIFTDDMKKIYNAFNNPHGICQKVIFKTKWHKIHIFNTPNKNKQRLTFSITKNEFVDIVQRCIHNGNNAANQNNKHNRWNNDDEKEQHVNNKLLPIVMFSNAYRVEYVQIIPLRKNIYIGISYVCDKIYGIKVTGIHLNKNYILSQHQLVNINHNCDCLKDFKSEIDFLHIGNPDDDKNRYKDLKGQHTKLQDKHANLNSAKFLLRCEYDKLQTQNVDLNIAWQQQHATINSMQIQINALKQQLKIAQTILMNNINPVLTPVSYIQQVTPQSVVSSISPNNNIQFPQIMVNLQSFPNPRHVMQRSDSSNVTNIITPVSFSNSTPQSQIGNLNTVYSQVINSQPNMNNSNSFNARNNNNKRQATVSHNEKNKHNNQNEQKNLSNNNMNTDGDNANN